MLRTILLIAVVMIIGLSSVESYAQNVETNINYAAQLETINGELDDCMQTWWEETQQGNPLADENVEQCERPLLEESARINYRLRTALN